MRGEILYYDETQGFGFIEGVDGNRYTFAREDMRRDGPVAKGMSVEFLVAGGQARQIMIVRPQQTGPATLPGAAVPAAAGLSAPPHFGRFGTPSPAEATGLWSYFRRNLTTNYANFSGRARRKEYWGYVLFWFLLFLVISIGGLIADGALGNLDFGGTGDAPIVTGGLCGLFVLATLLPGLGLTVRRLHDIGLSGWFYLLVFIPSIGSLIILVFTLIPTQLRDNKWGPVPAGITIPPSYPPPA